MTALLTAARNAKSAVGQLTTEQKNEALLAMADALEARQTEILAANTQDLAAAQGHISAVMLDRLRLTPGTDSAMHRASGRWLCCPTRWGRCWKNTPARMG